MAKKTRTTKAMARFAMQHAKTGNFTIKDYQRHCIVRGVPFEELAKMSVPQMNMWLFKNERAKVQPHLLDEYDEWKEKYLKARGMPDDYFHPMLRLGFIAEENEEGETIKRRRIKGIKKEKKKTEKTSDGLFSGTKKAMTFELTKQGLDLETIIRKVTERFPEAKDKSIHIWMKKCIRLNGGKYEKIAEKEPKKKITIKKKVLPKKVQGKITKRTIKKKIRPIKRNTK